MTERQRPYLAYLLRLWQIQDQGKIGWRASLENAHTGGEMAEDLGDWRFPSAEQLSKSEVR